MYIPYALTLIFVLYIGIYISLIIREEKIKKKVKQFLAQRFNNDFTFDKTVVTNQSSIVRLYSDNKYWEITVDKDRGIVKEKILINAN